jgi:hypothetical protein
MNDELKITWKEAVMGSSRLREWQMLHLFRNLGFIRAK